MKHQQVTVQVDQESVFRVSLLIAGPLLSCPKIVWSEVQKLVEYGWFDPLGKGDF
jgi:hypothetical protein